jgi:phage-related protein
MFAIEGPQQRAISGGDIYEVRADAATRSFRPLFSCEGKYSQVLLSLSVYEKRTQKAPTQEIDLAERRLKDWRTRAKNQVNRFASIASKICR